MNKYFYFLISIFLFINYSFSDEKNYIATITEVKGNVFIIKEDTKKSIKAKEYTPLEQTDTVKTGQKSSCEITFDDGSIIVLQSDTEVCLEKFKQQKNLRLKKGKLLSSIIKQTTTEYSNIRTPTCLIAVRGTEFAVDILSDEETNIGVFDGQIAVKHFISEEEISEEEFLLDKDFETTIKLFEKPQQPVVLGERMKEYKKTIKLLNKRFEMIRKNLNKYRDLRIKQFEKYREKLENKRKNDLEKYRNRKTFKK